MGDSVIIRSFGSGELAPALAARADLALYRTGLRTCRNFVVKKHGGAENRAGFRYIATTKTNSVKKQLLRYISETEGESILIEAGVNYLRFFKADKPVKVTAVAAWSGVTAYVVGDLVVSGGVNYYCLLGHTNHVPPNATYWYALTADIYEIPTPFDSDGVLFNWVQSGRVITLTHRDKPPMDLLYYSPTKWVLQLVNTAPSLPAPATLLLTPCYPGTQKVSYVVTAAAPDTYEESPPSNIATNAATGKPTILAPNILTWSGFTVNGVAVPQYYVYCDRAGNGTFGYIGTATGQAIFSDPGLVPDYSITPPVPRPLFDASGEYPHTAGFHKQRRFFGQTTAVPDQIEGSRVAFPSNFGISTPLQDDDALSFRLAGNTQNAVRHLLSVKDLIVLTGEGEWRVSAGAPNIPLAPNAISADQETYVGIAETRPVIIGNSLVYVESRGVRVHDLRFDRPIEGLGGRDLTVYAGHLFENHVIGSIDYQLNPDSVVWAVRDDGVLVGMTYLRELDQWGWHRHDTGAEGLFEQVCVVPGEASEDVLYAIVSRTINSATVRFIERLERRAISTLATDAFFVDAGISHEGAPITVLTGLGHLEGQVLAVLGDGVVLFAGDPTAAGASNFTVAGGQITLPAAYSVVIAGLPIPYADLETLDLDVDGSVIRDKKKKIGYLTVLLEASARTFQAGPTSAKLTRFRQAPYDPTDALFTGSVQMAVKSLFDDNGRIFIRHTDPLPMTVLGLIPNVEVGP